VHAQRGVVSNPRRDPMVAKKKTKAKKTVKRTKAKSKSAKRKK
jgi:hypothetical protein